MRLGDSANKVAASALLFEEFVARERDAGRFKIELAPIAAKALLHGHCHQKSFGAMAATEKALRLIPGLEVQTIEFELLRHGRRVRLSGGNPSNIASDGRTLAASPRARGGPGDADRRRRFFLPPSNSRWDQARGDPRRGGACARAGGWALKRAPSQFDRVKNNRALFVFLFDYPSLEVGRDDVAPADDRYDPFVPVARSVLHYRRDARGRRTAPR